MDERARSSLAAALAGGEPAVDGRRRARKGRVVARVEAARAAVVAARARPWPTARVASTREARPRPWGKKSFYTFFAWKERTPALCLRRPLCAGEAFSSKWF